MFRPVVEQMGEGMDTSEVTPLLQATGTATAGSAIALYGDCFSLPLSQSTPFWTEGGTWASCFSSRFLRKPCPVPSDSSRAVCCGDGGRWWAVEVMIAVFLRL